MKKNKNNSKFFNFSIKKSEKPFSYSSFLGWNKSLIVKVEFNSKGRINEEFIKKKFPMVLDKEKIFVITAGQSKLTFRKKNLNLNKFDVVSFFSEKNSYNFDCKKNTEIFIISSEKVKKRKNKAIYFNFRKNIQKKNIWGGKCISRSYSGPALNIVMFDLKKGFKFHDNGHSNEQITWLLSGSMNFYAGKKKSILSKNRGVDIGKFSLHGGISNGAVGFDVFFPKRLEKKYHHDIKVSKL